MKRSEEREKVLILYLGVLQSQGEDVRCHEKDDPKRTLCYCRMNPQSEKRCLLCGGERKKGLLQHKGGKKVISF